MTNIEQNEIERVPTGPRNALQFVVMEKMGIKRGDHEAQKEWSLKYAAFVSRIIDNPENHSIRESINNGNFDEAADMLIDIIENNKTETYH